MVYNLIKSGIKTVSIFLFLSIIILSFFLLTGKAEATTAPFTDLFDSYFVDDEICGINGWLEYDENHECMKVYDDVSHTPFNSIGHGDYLSGTSIIAREVDPDIFIVSFQFNASSTNPGSFFISDNAGKYIAGIVYGQVYSDPPPPNLQVWLMNSIGRTAIVKNNLSLDTWYNVTFEIDFIANRVRGKVDMDTYSNYQNIDPIDKERIILQTHNPVAGTGMRIDDFQIIPQANVLTIDSPLEAALLSVPTSLFTGKCTNLGEHQLFISNDIAPTSLQDFILYSDIPCEGYSWTVLSDVQPGNNTKTIYDMRWLTDDPQYQSKYKAEVNYVGFDQTTDYSMFIQFPPCSDFTCELEPNEDWVFRFRYYLTNDDLYDSLWFNIGEFVSGWGTEFEHLSGYYVHELDPEKDGFFDITPIGATQDAYRYYFSSIGIYDQATTTGYILNFRTIGSNSSSSIPFADPNDVLGEGSKPLCGIFQPICDAAEYMIIPSREKFKTYFQAVSDKMRTKFPLSYFYLLSDTISAYSTTTGEIVDFTVPLNFGGYQINTPILPSGENSLTDILDYFRPYIVTFAWLLLGLYILKRIL